MNLSESVSVNFSACVCESVCVFVGLGQFLCVSFSVCVCGPFCVCILLCDEVFLRVLLCVWVFVWESFSECGCHSLSLPVYE